MFFLYLKLLKFQVFSKKFLFRCLQISQRRSYGPIWTNKVNLQYMFCWSCLCPARFILDLLANKVEVMISRCCAWASNWCHDFLICLCPCRIYDLLVSSLLINNYLLVYCLCSAKWSHDLIFAHQRQSNNLLLACLFAQQVEVRNPGLVCQSKLKYRSLALAPLFFIIKVNSLFPGLTFARYSFVFVQQGENKFCQ